MWRRTSSVSVSQAVSNVILAVGIRTSRNRALQYAALVFYRQRTAEGSGKQDRCEVGCQTAMMWMGLGLVLTYSSSRFVVRFSLNIAKFAVKASSSIKDEVRAS